MGSETTQWTFQSGGSTHIVTITADGRVIRNPDVTWDEAALCFWEAVERVRQTATPTPTADGEADDLAQQMVNEWFKSAPQSTIADLLRRYGAALRARPALPADVQAVVEKVQPLAEYEGGTRLAYMDTEEAEMLAADLRTLLAHLQRQAAPVVVTEAMVHVASVALADEDGNHEWEALSDKTQQNYYATLRRVLTAALSARGED